MNIIVGGSVCCLADGGKIDSSIIWREEISAIEIDTPTTGALVSKNRLSSVRRASVVGVRHRPSRGYEAESKQDKIVLLNN